MNKLFIDTVCSLISSNGYHDKVDRLRVELIAHPEFPMLSALSDVFKLLDIPYFIGRLERKSIAEITTPYLAQASENQGGTMTLVLPRENAFYKIPGSSVDNNTTSRKELFSKTTNLVVLVEPNDERKDFSIYKLMERNQGIIFMITALCILSYIWMSSADLWYTVYSASSLIGVGVGILLFRIDIGLHDNLTNTLCGQNNTKCSHILNSKYAVLPGGIKLSDLVLLYFLTVAIFLILSFEYVLNHILTITALLTVPFILYSIIIQSKIRQWCVLCVSTLFILIAHALIVVISNESMAAPNLITTLSLMTSILIALSGWSYFRQIIKDTAQIEALREHLIKFKRNWSLFRHHIAHNHQSNLPGTFKNLPIESYDEGIWDVLLVMQPSCQACARTFHMIQKIQKERSCFKSIKIALYPKELELDSIDLKVTLILMDLFESSKETFWIALEQWMKHRDFKSWTFNYIPHEELLEKYRPLLLKIDEWANSHRFTKSPTVLLNRRQIPYLYGPEDFEFLLTKTLEEIITERRQDISKRIEVFS